MTQTINEAMERRAINLEIIVNRTATLKEHYDMISEKVKAMDSTIEIKPFGTLSKYNDKNELEVKGKFLDDMSKQYVKLINEYERLKDLKTKE